MCCGDCDSFRRSPLTILRCHRTELSPRTGVQARAFPGTVSYKAPQLAELLEIRGLFKETGKRRPGPTRLRGHCGRRGRGLGSEGPELGSRFGIGRALGRVFNLWDSLWLIRRNNNPELPGDLWVQQDMKGWRE